MKKTIYNLAQVALVLIATTMFTSCSLFHHDDDDVFEGHAHGFVPWRCKR